jgi:HK97 family phage major capsid protein
LVFSRKDRIEQRDMTTSGGPTLTFAGDAPFVPAGFYAKIEEAMKWYGGMQEVAEVLNTDTGQPLPYPTDNDTTNTGELVGEGQQVSTADASVGVVMFGAYKFSTKLVRVSIELLQDSAFDLESYLAKKFGIRLARIRNTKFTVGTGVNEPKGLHGWQPLSASALEQLRL